MHQIPNAAKGLPRLARLSVAAACHAAVLLCHAAVFLSIAFCATPSFAKDATPDACLASANALYSQERYFACIDQLQKCIATNPNNAESWRVLGNAYQRVHKPAKAAECYTKFIALSKEPQPQYQTLLSVLKGQEDQQSKVNDGPPTDNYLTAVTENGLFRWSHPERIVVSIEPGTNVPSYRPEFEEAVRQAFEDWSEASQHKFNFVVEPSASKPDIIVSWTNDLHAGEFSSEAGDCRLQCGSDGLTSASIRLLTVEVDKAAPLGKEMLHAVALHEIGHALGLQGHSGNDRDMMFPILKEDSISGRDVRTLYALYSPDLKVASQLKPVDAYGRNLTGMQLAQRLINDGSNAAVAGDYAKAKELLEKGLAIDSKNALALSNLVVCLNNLAIAPGCSEQQALNYLYESLYWNPKYEIALSNLKNFCSVPNTFEGRIRQAAARAQLGDLYGAIVEYRWALQLKNDPAARTKLTDCESKLRSH